jgi:NADH:ubiquinone oxidoreductase subunit F (NADH-binding)
LAEFSFIIKEGAGAFVCGEETALMQSIEGQTRYAPDAPPYPADYGLWGFPSNINNVETMCSVPSIILNGPDWFASIGTAKSGGTKAFALAGLGAPFRLNRNAHRHEPARIDF